MKTARLVGRVIGHLLNILLLPLLLLAIPFGLFKGALKYYAPYLQSKLIMLRLDGRLFNPDERYSIARSEMVLNRGIPGDEDHAKLAALIKNAQVLYKLMNSSDATRGRSGLSFSDYLESRLVELTLFDWRVCSRYFGLDKILEIDFDRLNYCNTSPFKLSIELKKDLAVYRVTTRKEPASVSINSDVHARFIEYGIYKNSNREFGVSEFIPDDELPNDKLWVINA